MLTPEDFRVTVERALENIDRDAEPRSLAAWFVDLARALEDVAHDVVPGYSDADADDLLDTWDDLRRAPDTGDYE